MKKNSFLILFAILFCFQGISQKISFHQKLKIFISDKASKNYQVKYINPDIDTIMKPDIKVYGPGDVLINYQLVKGLNWNKSKFLNKDNFEVPEYINIQDWLFADIKPDEGRLLVYFWPYKNKDSTVEDFKRKIKANDFIKKYAYSIELNDRTNLSFWSSECIGGILTLPIKIYFGGPDSVSAVQTAVGTGLYIGKKWGRRKFVKLPHEKEITVYKSAWSLNALAGINKVDIDEKNSKDGGRTFKGSFTSMSLGLASGFHYKSFTVFIASGFDIPLNNKGNKWTFKGKPWIGIGAGFEIF